MHARRSSLAQVGVVALAAASLTLITGGPAQAKPPGAGKAGFTAADPCKNANGTAYQASPGARLLCGVKDGAGYRIEVPARWNHELVMYAHGFVAPTTTVVSVQDPALRSYYIAKGYAWAASSYSTNGYDVKSGVQDTHRLLELFESDVARPARTYMTGVSMGGHITGVEIEKYRHDFAGAMPVCGVMGDAQLFNYYLDVNAVAQAVTGAAANVPADATYSNEVKTAILPKLGGSPNSVGFPTSPNPAGVELLRASELRSGGIRPGFDGAWLFYWNSFGFTPFTDIPFLFGVFAGSAGGTEGIASGNTTSNTATVYQLDSNPALSPAEQALNAAVPRLAATPGALHRHGLSGIPRINGTERIPTLTMHDIDDLFVPFSMEQIYARRTAANGGSRHLVQRAIRGTGHCEFTAAEMERGFNDLVGWVKGGPKPAGDAVRDPAVVAAPTFGCTFTNGPHIFLGATACPTAPAQRRRS